MRVNFGKRFMLSRKNETVIESFQFANLETMRGLGVKPRILKKQPNLHLADFYNMIGSCS